MFSAVGVHPRATFPTSIGLREVVRRLAWSRGVIGPGLRSSAPDGLSLREINAQAQSRGCTQRIALFSGPASPLLRDSVEMGQRPASLRVTEESPKEWARQSDPFHDDDLRAAASEPARLRATDRRKWARTVGCRGPSARCSACFGGEPNGPSGSAERRAPEAPGTPTFEIWRSDRQCIVRGCPSGAEIRLTGRRGSILCLSVVVVCPL